MKSIYFFLRTWLVSGVCMVCTEAAVEQPPQSSTWISTTKNLLWTDRTNLEFFFACCLFVGGLKYYALSTNYAFVSNDLTDLHIKLDFLYACEGKKLKEGNNNKPVDRHHSRESALNNITTFQTKLMTEPYKFEKSFLLKDLKEANSNEKEEME